ncbi:MAG: hypothetical protein JW776_16855 [Candidatus Lokiarchaeota archaeon]|nr:hypothetical protein [Candidatus Lokiarchaeota archaeon]
MSKRIKNIKERIENALPYFGEIFENPFDLNVDELAKNPHKIEDHGKTLFLTKNFVTKCLKLFKSHNSESSICRRFVNIRC